MPRTVLMHMNVVVPDDDVRSVPELVIALEAAIEVGSDDPTVRDLEVVLAEEVDGSAAESTIVDSPLTQARKRTEAAQRAAVKAWGSDECEIDDDARVSLAGEHIDTSAAWVSAWVYVDADQIKAEL